MNLNRIKMTMATGMLAASMILPGMTAYADAATDNETNASATVPTIYKYLTVADGVTVPDDIKFTIKQYDADKSSTSTYENADGTQQPLIITGEKTYTLYKSTDTNDSHTNKLADVADTDAFYIATGKNEKGSVSLGTVFDTTTSDTLAGLLTKNGEYTFELSETGLKQVTTGYGWTKVDSTTYYLHVYVTGITTDASGNADTTNKKVEWIATTDAGVNKDANDKVTSYKNKVSEIKFENTYTKKAGSSVTPDEKNPKAGASLVIEKAVDGADSKYEAAGTKYQFTVTFTASNTAQLASTYTYNVYKNGSTTPVKSNQTVASGNAIELESDQYAVFTDIPAGLKVTVEETGTLTNIKSTKNTVVSNGDTSVTTGEKTGENGKSTGAFLLGENANTATFTNTYTDITVTGVATSIAPYVTLVVVAVAAIAAYMALKRRIAR